MSGDILIGEHVRTLDGRFRLSLPPDFVSTLAAGGSGLVLAKERPGCLSLWPASTWKPRLDAAIAVLRSKLGAGVWSTHTTGLQELGRLLSTRHHPVRLAGRVRLVIPEGFRGFLGVAAGGDLLVVGAAVCVELWQPEAFAGFIAAEMPRFGPRLEELIG